MNPTRQKWRHRRTHCRLDVAGVKPELGLVRKKPLILGRIRWQNPRNHDKTHEKNHVVKRKDAKRAARVERPEIAGASLRVEEDSSNEESAQNEEKVHPRATGAGDRFSQRADERVAVPRGREMDQKHEDDRQSA